MKTSRVLLGLLICLLFLEVVSAIPNPSAVYCREMGYDYTILKLEDGSEMGICRFPDNTSCPAWDFYAGTCGQNWSYCAKNGYITVTMTDGEDPYSPVYSACADKYAANAELSHKDSSNTGLEIVGSISELMNLSEKLGCMCSLEVKNFDSEEQKECEEGVSKIFETMSLPSEFDWRNYNGADWVTTVKNQDCGGCWAFATVGGVEAKINIVENDPNFDVDLSEQYLVSDCFNCNPHCNCSGGLNTPTLQFIRDYGVPDECCYPHSGQNSPCLDRCSDYSKRLWKIDDFGTVGNDNDLKKNLVSFGPMVSAMNMTSGTFDADGIYRCAINNSIRDHAILIVGYNDNDGYWIVKNSYGADWPPIGGNGYFKVGYGECNIGDFIGGEDSLYIDMLKRSPEKTTTESFEVTTGSSSGSLSDTHTKYGDCLTLDEQCGLIGCDGLASDFTFTLPTDYIFDNLDVVSHIYSSESGFYLYIWNVQTGDWEYLADVPESCDSGEFEGSSTIHWQMVKYGICNSEEECRKYIDNSGHLKLNFSHESCLICNRDSICIDWLFLWKKDHFSINATPEKEGYEPGETAKVTIDVTNNGDQENIWLGVSFKDSTGESAKYNPQITITPESADIDSGETETFTTEWTIPNDAPCGEYEIAVNCWEDDTFTNRYTDDLEWEPIFYVYNLDILSPTTSSPAILGDPSTPTEFNAEVSTGIPFVLNLPGAFNAMVGSKPAGVIVIPSFFDNAFGYYTLQITPQTQDTEGSYDFNISFSLGEVSDYDVESDAVIYSTGGNIDVVEVIDRSGSMRGEPIQAAKDSAKLFVDLMNTNDMIGVASYSSSASVNYGLTEITSDTIKQNAKTAIDGISAGGNTSIGAGLQAAYNELVDKGDPFHPHSIVLMSDGWHNAAPHPDTVLPDIRNTNIKVFTIGLGAGADASLLSHIAHDSGGGGGEYYYAPGSGELSAIYNAIAGVVKAESTVKTVTGSVQQDETITHNVDIDPTIDVVTFTVTWTSGTLNLGLERPDGSKVDPSDPDVISHTKEATYETYTMDSPMFGEWTMEITAPSTSSSTQTTTSDLASAEDGVTANQADDSMIDDDWSTEIDVSAIIKSAQQAITTQSGISYTAAVTATTNLTVHIYTDKDQYSLNEPTKIITALTKAGSPVTGADVNVTIDRPDDVNEYLSLHDDGKHDDGLALDGVYANYYTNTGMSGSYTITVHASGTASPEEFTREVKKSVYVSGVSAGEISMTPTSWNTGIIHPGGDAISAFTVSSTSTKDETVMISATDLTDEYGNVIGSENVMGMPSTFVVPAGGSSVFYESIYVPETAKTGNYTGSIVLMSTANSVNIPVTLQADADLLLEYIGDTSGQYSDSITLEAQLTENDNPLPDKDIDFTLGTQTVTATTGSDGIASATIILDQPAGNYDVVADFAGDDDYSQASDTEPFTINPEDASVTFDVDNQVAVQVTEPGGKSGDFTLSVDVTETENSDALGEIRLAEVSMNLVPVGPGLPVSPLSCSRTESETTLTFVCEFNDLEVNTYSVQVTVDGDYYTGSAEDVLVIYNPSLGFTVASNGGGSSGGGASGELYENIVCSETDRQYVNQNSHISYSFDLDSNIVQYVNFTGLISAGSIATKVEILNDTSTLVDHVQPDIVYMNLNIWVGNTGWATEKNIAGATVVFTVDKSWIIENNIDESSIAFYRYSDNNWNKLVIIKIAEDANSLQFEAEIPGFSSFAVTGKKTMVETQDENIIVEPTITAEKNPAPTPTEKKGMPGFSLFVCLSVLLTAVGLLHKKN